MSGSLSYGSAATPYLSTIDSASSTYGVPSNLLYAVIGAESSFNPSATTSGSSSAGLGGFIDSTAQSMGVDQFDPTSSINGAAQYLSQLFKQTGSWSGAVNAYGTTVTQPGQSPTAGQSDVASIAAALDGNGTGSSGGGSSASAVGSIFGGTQDLALRVGVGMIALLFIGVGLASLAFGSTPKEVVKAAIA